IELQRALDRLPRTRGYVGGKRRAGEEYRVVRVGETGERSRVARLLGDRSLELLHRPRELRRPIPCSLIPVTAAAHGALIVLRAGAAVRPGGVLVRGHQLRRQGVGDARGDVGLDGEDVLPRSIVGFTPQLRLIVGADQLRRDAKPIVGVPDAAFEYVVDAEL